MNVKDEGYFCDRTINNAIAKSKKGGTRFLTRQAAKDAMKEFMNARRVEIWKSAPVGL